MGMFDDVGGGGAAGGALGGAGTMGTGFLGGQHQSFMQSAGYGSNKMSPEELNKLMREQAKIREESFARLAAKASEARDADMAKGRARGQELFGTPFVQASQGERSQDMASVIAARKAGMQGYSAPETNALRDQMQQGVSRQEATTMRQLRGSQAQSGVRGALAATQQAQVLQEMGKQRAQAEREIFIQNMAQKQTGLDKFEQSLRGAETEEIQRYGQRQTGKLGTEMGYAQMGAADRAAIQQQLLGESQAALNANIGSRGGKK